jgi:oxygen-independent coproporphyrinogen-3 oxidase
VTAFQAAGGIHSELPTPALEQLLDRLMVGLRLKEGISGDEVRSYCPPATWIILYQTLKPHIQAGLVMVEGDSWATLRRLRLSDPEGFLFSNVVLSDCFRAVEDLGHE